jgi:hypothetical protein
MDQISFAEAERTTWTNEQRGQPSLREACEPSHQRRRSGCYSVGNNVDSETTWTPTVKRGQRVKPSAPAITPLDNVDIHR